VFSLSVADSEWVGNYPFLYLQTLGNCLIDAEKKTMPEGSQRLLDRKLKKVEAGQRDVCPPSRPSRRERREDALSAARDFKVCGLMDVGNNSGWSMRRVPPLRPPPPKHKRMFAAVQ